MSEKSLWLFFFILLYAVYCFFWGVRGSRCNSENPEILDIINKSGKLEEETEKSLIKIIEELKKNFKS